MLSQSELAGATVVFGLGKRSEEHTSELQSHLNLVCRLLLEKKKKTAPTRNPLRQVRYALLARQQVDCSRKRGRVVYAAATAHDSVRRDWSTRYLGACLGPV